MGWVRYNKSFWRAVGSIGRVGLCLVVGVSSAAAGTIGLHASDLDVADLYVGETIDVHAAGRDAGEAFPALAGLRFSAIDVIDPALGATDVARQARDQIQEWTGAQTGPFDTNVTLAALVSGSIAVPGEAAPQAVIDLLATEPGSSVAPARGPLAPEALASAMPTTHAGVVSPSLFAQPAASPASGSAPPAPAPVDERPPSRGPSLLTIVAMAALVVIGATTFAYQGDRSYRRRRHHRTQRDF